ncbi:MAG: nucleotidyltransferase domain-containing protein [Candidatus Latescibacterota bacterium]|nr:MAG: nucleotidyltransferase domain-containing protein [Candidatus Latescibacterota bacterium]
MDRKRTLERELQRILKILMEEESPQKVILFGSLAEGKVEEWSDIDLVVIQETEAPFLERIKRLLLRIRPRVGIDLLVYTPEEFEGLCKTRPFFLEEVLKKGKVLYERGSELA